MDSKMSDVENTLISLNNLEYTLPESLSVVVTKQHKSFPALKREYKSEEKIDFIMTAGQQYVDTNESFITFDLVIKGLSCDSTGNPILNQEYNLGANTPANERYAYIRHIMDLFRHVRFTHASGTILYEDDYFNFHWLHDKVMELDQNKFVELMKIGHGHVIDGGDTKADYANGSGNGYAVESTPHFYAKHPVMVPGGNKQLEFGGSWANDFSTDTTGTGNIHMQSWTLNSPFDINKTHTRYVKYQPYNNTNANQLVTVTYTIPLHWFSCFRNDSNSLMPSMLLNGSRLELILDGPGRFFCNGVFNTIEVPSYADYAVSNPQVHLSLIDLSSRIFAVLLQESINNGLEWSFDSTYTIPQSEVSQSFTMEATRALSRVKTAKVIPYSSSAVQNNVTLGADDNTNFIYKPVQHVSFFTPNKPNFKFKKWKFMLGSMSYPANDVRLDINDGARLMQTYMHAYNAYGWSQSKMAAASTLGDFESGAFYQAVQSLERSSTLQQSGLSLSMDASLRFVGELGGGLNTYVDKSASVYLFVTYSSVVVIIGDKVIVKS
jgi:hypothetical protein